MFAPDEIEALALGSQWVADRADARLGHAARNAMAKIAAVIPAELRHELETSALLVGPGAPIAAADANLAPIRQAIRAERKLEVAYKDQQSRSTTRTVWPFALGFFDRVQVLVAFCELRDSVRHFRTDRIASLQVLDARYPRRRHDLLKEWRATETADRS
jgi:predicted DNA-binding transcriptional regulator YafY